jgi:hypothetical protein
MIAYFISIGCLVVGFATGLKALMPYNQSVDVPQGIAHIAIGGITLALMLGVVVGAIFIQSRYDSLQINTPRRETVCLLMITLKIFKNMTTFWFILLSASAIHGIIIYGDYARLMNMAVQTFSGLYAGIVITLMAILRFTRLTKPMMDEGKVRTLSESRFEREPSLELIQFSSGETPFSDVNRFGDKKNAGRFASSPTVISAVEPVQSLSIIP